MMAQIIIASVLAAPTAKTHSLDVHADAWWQAQTRIQVLEEQVATLSRLMEKLPTGLSSAERILGTWEVDPEEQEWNAPWVIADNIDVHTATMAQNHLGDGPEPFSSTRAYGINKVKVVIQTIDNIPINGRPRSSTDGRVFTGMVCGGSVRSCGKEGEARQCNESFQYILPLQGVLHNDLTSGPVGALFSLSNFPGPGARNTTAFDGWWENINDNKVPL